MRPISLAGLALAFSAGVSAQLSLGLDLGGSDSSTSLSTSAKATSTSTSKAVPATLSTSSSSDAKDKVKTTTSDARSSSTTQSPSPTTKSSSLNLDGDLSSLVGTVNSSLPALKHVDTILDTQGVPSTQQVMAAKLTTFCAVSAPHASFCKQLQNIVAVCVDMKNNCTDTTARNLLAFPLNNKLCSTAVTGTIVDKICSEWYVEATRCKNKTKRGPCAYHHVLYLLRELRDFLALPKGQVSMILRKREEEKKAREEMERLKEENEKERLKDLRKMRGGKWYF